MFLAAHYFTDNLTIPIIFSSLEIFVSIKASVYTLSVGLGFYYEIQVVFARFASVFNMPRIAMLKID
jgi:hypothetical protein